MTADRKRIFIVEDQRLIAADLDNTLLKLGYLVAGSVASGAEAVEQTLALRPDLVLMDIRLQGDMDGIEASEAIRQRFDVPVVFLTAYADEETLVRAKLAAPYGYVVKPFNQRELRAAIEIALYKHEADELLSKQRARLEAAEQFRLLVDSVRDYAIFKLDCEGLIISWNAGAERIKGYRADEIIGQHFSILHTPEAIAAGEPERHLAVARREGRFQQEGWRVRKDGSRFWASVVITALFDADGRLLGFAKVARDMTEARRHEQALEQAIRARDEFLQVASHELKTPLTTLLIQLDTLKRTIESAGALTDSLSDSMDLATRQSVRLSRLIDSLLDVTRISGGRLVLEPVPFDFAEMLREMIDRLQVEARRLPAKLTLDAPASVPGTWDRLRVEQLVSNLLSNALKYGLGNPVTVELRDLGDRIQLSVTDGGIGIEPEFLQRIFDRFERAVSYRHYGGLGLGLFIAREITQAHGGVISARSEPGVGSTFTVVLPRTPPQPPPRNEAPGG